MIFDSPASSVSKKGKYENNFFFDFDVNRVELCWVGTHTKFLDVYEENSNNDKQY
jgi:hypothetical protein